VTFDELLSDSCLPHHESLQQSATMMAFETILNCRPFWFWTLCLMKILEFKEVADQALLEKTPYQLSKWSVATEVPCFVMSHMMRW
jgi:hypothetical protein